MLRLSLVAVLVSGCAVVGAEDGSLEQASATEAPIDLLDGGQWGRHVGCPSPDPATCQSERNVWVDLAIRNDAYDKRVGIVWIDTVRDDANGPWKTAYATYEGARDGGWERWGVDFTAGTYGGLEPRPRIRLAAFVEMNGVTSWDNNGGADYLIE